MKSTRPQAQDLTTHEGLGTAPNRGEAHKAHIDAAFQLLSSKAGRRFVYDTVCSAISDPERLTYEVALVISGRTRDDHVRAEEVFGDVSTAQ